MASVWRLCLFCIAMWNVVPYISAALPGESAENVDTKTCQENVGLCTLDAKNVILMKPTPGAKGDQGDPGLRGLDGLMGAKGLRGEPGLQGASGFMGSKGDMGLPGISGPMGDPGNPGFPGPPGESPQPEEVEVGDMGEPGSMGPPGPPGENGICPCSYLEDTPVEDSFATVDEPGNVACKAAPFTINTGEYCIGPGMINVTCVKRTSNLTMLTCVLPENKNRIMKNVEFSYRENFWASEKGFILEDIYGLSRSQLAWLQKNSNSAYQTIRYHCLNSNPFPRDNVNKSLLLLGWNDVAIGPVPTLNMPVFYSVPAETDGCSKIQSKGKWAFTDIVVSTEVIHRVPIVDFLIRDADGLEPQSLRIESIKLCFD